MSAIRLARGHTGRDKYIKFEGNYHGHSDSLLVAAGSGLVTLGIPSTPGVTAGTVADTVVLPYNDLEAVSAALEAEGEQIAAIILEPIAGNMGVVPPKPGYLQGLRDLCDRYGVVLIFDEVISGFRVALGGAQELYGVTPDLTTLGKIIGGGFPVGAFGGKREIMEKLAPVGPVYQAGTLSGNPVAMVAGLATLNALSQPGVYDELERKGRKLADGLCRAAGSAPIHVACNRVGSMSTMFFTHLDVSNWTTASTADTEKYGRYFRGMLDRRLLARSEPVRGVLRLARAHRRGDRRVHRRRDRGPGRTLDRKARGRGQLQRKTRLETLRLASGRRMARARGRVRRRARAAVDRRPVDARAARDGRRRCVHVRSRRARRAADRPASVVGPAGVVPVRVRHLGVGDRAGRAHARAARRGRVLGGERRRSRGTRPWGCGPRARGS